MRGTVVSILVPTAVASFLSRPTFKVEGGKYHLERNPANSGRLCCVGPHMARHTHVKMYQYTKKTDHEFDNQIYGTGADTGESTSM